MSYAAAREATTAVLGGQVQMTFVNITGLPPLIADGKLRALAVTGRERRRRCRTCRPWSSGYPATWSAPSSASSRLRARRRPIVNRLNAAMNEGMSTPEMRATIARMGAVSPLGSPEDFAASSRHRTGKWQAVAKAAGNIRVD